MWRTRVFLILSILIAFGDTGRGRSSSRPSSQRPATRHSVNHGHSESSVHHEPTFKSRDYETYHHITGPISHPRRHCRLCHRARRPKPSLPLPIDISEIEKHEENNRRIRLGPIEAWRLKHTERTKNQTSSVAVPNIAVPVHEVPLNITSEVPRICNSTYFTNFTIPFTPLFHSFNKTDCSNHTIKIGDSIS